MQKDSLGGTELLLRIHRRGRHKGLIAVNTETGCSRKLYIRKWQRITQFASPEASSLDRPVSLMVIRGEKAKVIVASADKENNVTVEESRMKLKQGRKSLEIVSGHEVCYFSQSYKEFYVMPLVGQEEVEDDKDFGHADQLGI